MALFCLDASALITSWKQLYPRDIFPSLWSQLSEKMGSVALIKPIYNELKVGNDDLFKWIEHECINIFDLDNEIEQLALELESEYETNNFSDGAGSIDIKLIAFAKRNQYSIVTCENPQMNIPDKKSKYKIPLICEEQSVECLTIVEFLYRLEMRI